MNILFLTISSSLKDISVSGIYTDLMRKFCDEGHDVYIIYPNERRCKKSTELKKQNHLYTLGVKTLNLTKTNVIEKGIGQVLLDYKFKVALKRYFSDVRFDVVLYSTPPITFTGIIEYVKTRNPQSMSYLMLKDIFPQNALDLGMLTTTGFRGILYHSFRRKEKVLYSISDYIGCMSPANVEYLLKHNLMVDPKKVEIAPNSFANRTVTIHRDDYVAIRAKYNLPIDRPIFIYGGNLGKPQGIPFLIECMMAVKDRNDCYFVIVGDGTEYPKLEMWLKHTHPKSVSLFRSLPKEDYDALTRTCDVGLIFLDYRFTIPNYPSRLLSYLMERKPIIAVTDPNCDTGTLAETNGYGFWCPSNSVDTFVSTVNRMLVSDIKLMGENGYRFYLRNYTVDSTYNTIMKHISVIPD